MANRSARDRAEREARRRRQSFEVRQAVHADRRRRIRRDDVVAGIAVAIVLALATLSQVGWATIGPGAPTPAPTASAQPTPTPTPTRSLPPASLSGDRRWTGSLTLNSTTLTIELLGKKAPQAVASFVALTRDSYYTGTPCHRLTTSGLYVLQCGDPTGTGSGGPGYTFGPLEDVPKDGVYPAGTIAMARGTSEDSQGSQFFIVYRASTLPSPGYTVFGRVTGGLDALKTAITSKGSDDSNAAGDGKPNVATTLKAVTVR